MVVGAGQAGAHELRPAFLSMEESKIGTYQVLWKTPALGEKQLALKALFPKSCTISNGVRTVEANKFAIETWTLQCGASLRGQTLTIGGLEKTLTDVLVRVAWVDGSILTTRLVPEKNSLTFAQTPQENAKVGGAVRTYFVLGVSHILGGIDHLLFVLAVMLLITRGKKLLWAITAFTLGHSVTLALATLGLVQMQPGLVEVLIALSIVLMAYEAARRILGHGGLTLSFPWLVTFSFGLLHGFGFAGALREIGLPQSDVPVALLFFNVGVEAGQLLFIGVALALVFMPLAKGVLRGRNAELMASYLIGILAVFWALQRALPLFAGA